MTALLPSFNRVLATISVQSAVPTLHRLDGDPVANPDCSAVQRRTQRRVRSRQQRAIARNR